MTMPGETSARYVAAAAMAAVVFVLALLFLAATGMPIAIPLLGALAVAVSVAVWLAASGVTAKSVWGRGCLVNGLLSAIATVGVRVEDGRGPGEFVYPDDLDRLIGPLNHFVWAFLARAGLVFFGGRSHRDQLLAAGPAAPQGVSGRRRKCRQSTSHPLMQMTGHNVATLRDRPAAWAASTTAVLSL